MNALHETDRVRLVGRNSQLTLQPPTVLHARVITGSGGGPDKTMLNSPRFLARAGYRGVCMYLRSPKDNGFQTIRDRALQWNSPLYEIDDTGPLDWKIVPKTIELCQRENVKIWHAHDYKTNLLGLLVHRKWPMRLVTTVHGWVQLTAKTRLYHFLDRFTLPRYKKVICVSPDLLTSCRKKGVGEHQSSLIENAIDTEQFLRRQSVTAAKRRLGLSESELLVGAVGRLSPEKGFDRLIRIIKSLNDRGIHVNLIVLGNGSQRLQLESLIRDLKISDRVTLAGFQSNPSEWYEAMDVFALPSLREGLPNVALEAMALKTPVVATNVAGVPNLIENGSSGVIVPIGDNTAFMSALASLLTNHPRRQQLANEARRMIESRYSFAARMEKIVKIYQELDQ